MYLEDETKLLEILSSQKKLEKLLMLEKERRRVGENELVFIGMADTALYWWCAMKSLFANRKMELAYFAAYLEDRIRYSLELKLIKKLPHRTGDLLKIGNEITFLDIEKLLKRREGIYIEALAETVKDKQGNIIFLLNPNLLPKERERFIKEARKKKIRIGKIEEIADPKVRGEFLHHTIKEMYPTIRWNFEWDKYVIVGVPDGITKRFVYEFKTTVNKFLLYFVKPVAETQADFYGYFFKRKSKRVQIYLMKERKIETFEEPINKEKVFETLKNFKKVDKGGIAKIPQRWKCKSCEFIKTCPLLERKNK
jgi:CRISPR/Cas system-associated exonuclease Cas4 (RecB family)